MVNIKKHELWIIRILIIAGLGCSVLYSSQLFDGVNATKSFFFILVVCLMLFFASVWMLGIKKNTFISLTIPDILFALYAGWAFVRLLTSDTDSVHNLYFWEFSACVLWYYCLRFFFGKLLKINRQYHREGDSPKQSSDYLSAGLLPASFLAVRNDEKTEEVPFNDSNIKHIFFSFIAFGYVQLVFCVLQLSGIAPSFLPTFPVSGTFDNTSKLCIYLTCVLPVAVHSGLKASDTTSAGKTVRTVCLLFALCWLLFILVMGSRTSLLSGFIGMGVYAGFQTGFFRRLRGKIRIIVVSAELLLVVCGLVILLAQYKKDSANGRLLIWKATWLGIKEAPLHGQGFNAFQAKYGHFQAVYFQKHDNNQQEMMLADNMLNTMNDYIYTAFNLGLTGLLLFVAFWLSLIFMRNDWHANDTDKIDLHRFLPVVFAVIIIFLVSGGFYFVEKILSVKVIVLFFAAYAASLCEKKITFPVRSTLLKFVAVLLLFFSCFAGYATVNKTKLYAQWKKANTLERFGYTEEAVTEYKSLYPHLRYNGQFLYVYARTLYENAKYSKCLAYMEKAKPKIANSDFYTLLGDAHSKTGDYENAIEYYEYAASMVPNRFRPLFKLFMLYEETGQTQQSLRIAHKIVNKPVKVVSNEVTEIVKECSNYIYLIEYENVK